MKLELESRWGDTIVELSFSHFKFHSWAVNMAHGPVMGLSCKNIFTGITSAGAPQTLRRAISVFHGFRSERKFKVRLRSRGFPGARRRLRIGRRLRCFAELHSDRAFLALFVAFSAHPCALIGDVAVCLWKRRRSRELESRIRELEASLKSSSEKCAAERQGRTRAQQVRVRLLLFSRDFCNILLRGDGDRGLGD